MIKAILNLFFPVVCAGCDMLLLHSESVICTRCRHEMPLTRHHLHTANEALEKFYGRVPVENASCFLYFNKKGIVQQLIHKLKYQGREDIGKSLGDWFASDISKIAYTPKIDEIIPVPLHKRRLRKRGYNQVQAFGHAISKGTGIPYNSKLLVRNRYSKTQTRKNLLGRSDMNVALFGTLFNENDCGKHFLLIDDVLTTGATLEACCRVLLKIPGTRVSIACIAFAHS